MAAPDAERELLLIRLVERRARIEANELTSHQALAGNGLRPSREIEIRCECGREDCATRIRVSQRQYAALRRARHVVMIVPGHQLTDDRLQRLSDTFWVVHRPIE